MQVIRNIEHFRTALAAVSEKYDFDHRVKDLAYQLILLGFRVIGLTADSHAVVPYVIIDLSHKMLLRPGTGELWDIKFERTDPYGKKMELERIFKLYKNPLGANEAGSLSKLDLVDRDVETVLIKDVSDDPVNNIAQYAVFVEAEFRDLSTHLTFEMYQKCSQSNH